MKEFTDDEILDSVKPFQKDLTTLINKHGMEKFSDTPDYILADHLVKALIIFGVATRQRDRWYGFKSNETPKVKP